MSAVILPMCGRSTRFKLAGYKIEKFMLPVNNNSMFYECASSLVKLISPSKLIIVVRDLTHILDFVEIEVDKLNRLFPHLKISLKTVDRPTSGTAETVFKALSEPDLLRNNEPFVTSPCDLFYSSNLSIRANMGTNFVVSAKLPPGQWAHVETSGGRVTNVSKMSTGKLASTGLYGFASKSLFMRGYENCDVNYEVRDKNEFDIETIINKMILENGVVFDCFEFLNFEVTMLGTPEEYEHFVNNQRI